MALESLHHRKAKQAYRWPDDPLRAWNDGVGLLEQGQTATALAIFHRLAEQNYEGAAFVVGRLFEEGSPELPVNEGDAAIWYQVAIRDEEDTNAMLALACLLLRKSSEIPRALALLEEAMAKGNVKAKLVLATLLEAGHLVDGDLVRAEELYEEALSESYVYAGFRLARLYGRRGRVIRAIKLRFRTALLASKIAKTNANDDRLWQVRV